MSRRNRPKPPTRTLDLTETNKLSVEEATPDESLAAQGVPPEASSEHNEEASRLLREADPFDFASIDGPEIVDAFDALVEPEPASVEYMPPEQPPAPSEPTLEAMEPAPEPMPAPVEQGPFDPEPTPVIDTPTLSDVVEEQANALRAAQDTLDSQRHYMGELEAAALDAAATRHEMQAHIDTLDARRMELDNQCLSLSLSNADLETKLRAAEARLKRYTDMRTRKLWQVILGTKDPRRIYVLADTMPEALNVLRESGVVRVEDIVNLAALKVDHLIG